MRLITLCCLIALAVVAVGCSSSSSPPNRSVLEAPSGRPGGKQYRIGPKQAVAGGRQIRASWRADLINRAKTYPGKRFDNPGRSDLMRRLRDFANRDGFNVVSAKVLRPKQDAPMIIVSTTHYLGLARATSGILKELNARSSVSDDRRGWRYEGFYWEARDERGVPFLITSTLTRGEVEGQQWARSEPLFTFPHG